MDIKFRDIKRFISRTDRISICIKETMDYENYHFFNEVPEKYDDYYVYGIGVIESEFTYDENYPNFFPDKTINDHLAYMTCLEIMLSDKPRD